MDDYNVKDFLERRGRLPLDKVIARLLRTGSDFWIVYNRNGYDFKKGEFYFKKCKLYFSRKNLIYFDDEIIVIVQPSCLKVIKVSEVIEIAVIKE